MPERVLPPGGGADGAGAGQGKGLAADLYRQRLQNRFRFLRRWEGLPLEAAEAVPDESGRAVLEAVLSLPEKYRAPVHLYYYEGYSQKEIAEILGLRLTAVQTRMQRARAILKEVLSDDDAI